ncbi:MAG: Aluminum resistance protein [Brockia lithotrophica]|uniref:Aluminum resistance protein n=1 Tax=Brockia lithotrophica TaxID=933949 RepID=A0A2T5G629_9BACL|nr:MAG: Aluminum resistance protein [Brockia lithotrophica]
MDLGGEREALLALAETVERELAPLHRAFERRAERHLERILAAMQRHRISGQHLVPSTGYGLGDVGRRGLEAVYAEVFGGEAALVSPHILSGTHALAVALFGLLRPGDGLVLATGVPYDTLLPVIGIDAEGRCADPPFGEAPASEERRPRALGPGSLCALGVRPTLVPLRSDGRFDREGAIEAIRENTRVVFVQRSRGYANVPSRSVEEIADFVEGVRRKAPHVFVLVDNCYGEFVEEREPTHAGADLIVGSLIKNPGGGLAKGGGYLVGSEEAVSRAAERYTAPGIGKEIGATYPGLGDLYMGFFLAPHHVAEALKGASFAAALLARLGFAVSPAADEPRTDIIQAITFGNRDALLDFLAAVQEMSPVDAFVTPVPDEMPGYADLVVMAGGTFVQGSTAELSADAPIRPPYVAYLQGGLTYAHVKLAALHAARRLLEKGHGRI